MSAELEDLLWPIERLPEAVEQLAQRAGYDPRAPDARARLPESTREPSRAWMFALAGRLGVEVEPVTPLYRELPSVIERSAPALLQVRCGGQPRYLVLLGASRRRATLLGRDGRVAHVPTRAVRDSMREEKHAAASVEVERLLGGVALSERGRRRVRAKLLLERLGRVELRTSWLVRPARTARVTTLVTRIPQLVAAILVNHVLLSLTLAGSFWILGRSALQTGFDRGWFWGWIAVLGLSVPLRLLEVWWQGLFSLRLGGLLKQQLLAGILALEPDEIRRDGVGRHFGRVAESELVELLALGGGLLALLSLADLVLAAWILQQGAGGWLQVSALLLWTLLGVGLASRHYTAQRRWSLARVDITHDLLERMLGHRTRLAQLPLERWHDEEDQRLSAYHDASRRMDLRTMQLSTLLSGGWLSVGLATLLPAFASGSATANGLAIAVGGMLLALRAFEEIGIFFQQISLAVVSFEQIRELLAAVARPQLGSRVPLALEAAHGEATRIEAGEALLEGRGLTFRHQGRSRPVLENVSLRVSRGDRILLEGPSGGGKSTLVSLLTGMRTPETGVLLFKGLDRASFGVSGWRRRVTAAPQFHENHVLSGSFAYNLLLGKEWPASAESRDQARAVCEELGLGDLISRMPSGLDEMIGETGWQLSHGEKSRLYIARTLLQGVELVVLDESFASLDPETMGVAVRCVLDRAPAVVVVSHP